MARDYADGDVIFDTQWRALKNAINGNAITVKPTIAPAGGMNVGVSGSAGGYRNGAFITITPGTAVFTTAAAYSKWGACWADAAGTIYVAEGAEAARPLMPEPLDWNDVLLFTVLITPGMTVITANDIVEMMFINPTRAHMALTTNPHSVTYSQAGAEQAFSKNTAFNKNFETTPSVLIRPGTPAVGTAGTVTRADHAHPLPYRYFASNELRATNAAVQWTGNTTWTLLKSNTVTQGFYASMRISFQLRSSGFGTIVEARIYVNGSPVGTTRQTNDVPWLTFVEDITDIEEGDIVTIYGRVQSAGPTSQVQNFLMLFSDFHEDAIITTGV